VCPCPHRVCPGRTACPQCVPVPSPSVPWPHCMPRAGWNRFDFALTTISMLDFALHQADTSLPAHATALLTSLLRFALGLRVLRFLSIGPLARVLLKLYAALPMVSNVMGVLMIVLYVYAILGKRACNSTERASCNQRPNPLPLSPIRTHPPHPHPSTLRSDNPTSARIHLTLSRPPCALTPPPLHASTSPSPIHLAL